MDLEIPAIRMRTNFAAILLAHLAVPSPAHAWGREGHVIVAEIAVMHLPMP